MTSDPRLLVLHRDTGILARLPVGSPLVDVDSDPPRRAIYCAPEENWEERPRVGVFYLDSCGKDEFDGYVNAVHPNHFAFDLSVPDGGGVVDGFSVAMNLFGWSHDMAPTTANAISVLALTNRLWKVAKEMGVEKDDPLRSRLAVAELLRDGGGR